MWYDSRLPGCGEDFIFCHAKKRMAWDQSFSENIFFSKSSSRKPAENLPAERRVEGLSLFDRSFHVFSKPTIKKPHGMPHIENKAPFGA